MSTLSIVVSILLASIIGAAGTYFIIRFIGSNKIQAAEERAKAILQKAKTEAEMLKIEAKTEIEKQAFNRKKQVEEELKKEYEAKKAELKKLEDKLHEKEVKLEVKQEKLELKEEQLKKREEEIENLYKQIEEEKNKLKEELEKIAGLTADEAKEELVNLLEEELKMEFDKRIKQFSENLKQEEKNIAKSVLATAIQRCAVDVANEVTTSVVNLPRDDLKGRIIGREGRNIRTFEMLTGVDLIIDDTPEVVVLSSFNPVRREIARLALERLVEDGRIHPARIEEEVEKAKREIEEQMVEDGKAAAAEVGIHNLPYDVIKLIGRLKFRRSYGQNILKHSIEVAKLAGMIAAEIGADEQIAKRAGLLHDIGKAIDYEVEGTHALIGADILKKYGENRIVINAVAAHHEEVEPESVEAIIVQIADAVSASRAGARSETVEAYIKRIEQLEEIASSFEGVQKVFAVQAGRELRVIVKPEEIKDESLDTLAYEISKKIEESVEYPGQIKVVVIREVRGVGVAK